MKKDKDIIIAFVILACSVVSFHLGAMYSRIDIIQTIKRQEEGKPVRLIKVPQLKMVLIPHEKGFISWDDK